MIGLPLRIALHTLLPLLPKIGDERRQVVERIGVVVHYGTGAGRRGIVVSGDVGRDVVGDGATLKEIVQAVLLHQEQGLGNTKHALVGRLVVEALERYLCCEQGIALVSLLHLFHGQGHLCEETCRSLQVGVLRLVHQLLEGLRVVDDLCGLQHLAGSCQHHACVDY